MLTKEHSQFSPVKVLALYLKEDWFSLLGYTQT